MGNTHGFARRQRPQMMASWELKDHESSRSQGTEVYTLTRLLRGDHLEGIIDDSARYGDADTVELYSKPMIDTCNYLMGFIHEKRKGDRQHPHSESVSAELWVLFFKIFLSVYMNDYEAADHYLCELKRSKRSYTVPLVIENHMIFYEGIIAAVMATRGNNRQRRRNVKLAQRKLRKLRMERVDEDSTLWNKVFLLEAQIHAYHGQHEAALLLFHKSIELAEREGFTHEEGLANELAGLMCEGCGRNVEGDLYLSQAQACYGRWGANTKVEQLDQRTSARSQSCQSRSSSSRSQYSRGQSHTSSRTSQSSVVSAS